MKHDKFLKELNELAVKMEEKTTEISGLIGRKLAPVN